MHTHTAVSGIIDTEYSQVYFRSGDDFLGLTTEAAFLDHANGLLGAGQQGCLFLFVGVTNGALNITVENHATRPPVDAFWEEVVEASCTVAGPPIRLESWDGASFLEPELTEGQYRVRFCATAYGRSKESAIAGPSSSERYALIFWPESPRPDEIIKRTSGLACQRHEWVLSQPLHQRSLPT
jgi:hypothetical protein